MTKKENMQEYPVFTRADCPNKIVKWLDKRITDSDTKTAEQIHEYHMEMLSVKQTIVNHTLFLRLGAVGFLILMILFLTSC